MKYLLILILYVLSSTAFAGKERIFIADPSVDYSQKDAILILAGFGSKIQGTAKIAEFFFNKGTDAYIPDYISRTSIAKSVSNLDGFITKYHLNKYRRIYVFSYIVGSWTLNQWIAEHAENNISVIVYDRSPLQERAPFALVRDIPVLIKMVSGKIMKEFSLTPYPPMTSEKIKVGIVVESKATPLLAKHKKSAMILGPLSWDPGQFHQRYDDLFYTWLNHDEMYNRFDISGPEILSFFERGKFTSQARREAYTEDPFIKHVVK